MSIKIAINIPHDIAGERFFKAEIPPSKGVRNLYVHWKYIERRFPFIPDLGEVGGFQLSYAESHKHAQKKDYFIIPRRNYKLVIFNKELLAEKLPELIERLKCDSITHFIISTKIYNSIVIDEDKKRIIILGNNPKDFKHPTTIMLLGDAECPLSLEKENLIIGTFISFIIRK